MGTRPRGKDVLKKATLNRIRNLMKPYHVTRGESFRMKDFDPGDTHGIGCERKEISNTRGRSPGDTRRWPTKREKASLPAQLRIGISEVSRGPGGSQST
jgi:hypothetical protein